MKKHTLTIIAKLLLIDLMTRAWPKEETKEPQKETSQKIVPSNNTEPTEFKEDERKAYVVFELESLRFAIDADYVEKIYDIDSVTRLPGCPPYILGLTNHDGQVLPLLDLDRYLDSSSAPILRGQSNHMRILIITIDDVDLGIPCKRVLGVPEIKEKEFIDPLVLRSDSILSIIKKEWDGPMGVVGQIDLPTLINSARI